MQEHPLPSRDTYTRNHLHRCFGQACCYVFLLVSFSSAAYMVPSSLLKLWLFFSIAGYQFNQYQHTAVFWFEFFFSLVLYCPPLQLLSENTWEQLFWQCVNWHIVLITHALDIDSSRGVRSCMFWMWLYSWLLHSAVRYENKCDTCRTIFWTYSYTRFLT